MTSFTIINSGESNHHYPLIREAIPSTQEIFCEKGWVDETGQILPGASLPDLPPLTDLTQKFEAVIDAQRPLVIVSNEKKRELVRRYLQQKVERGEIASWQTVEQTLHIECSYRDILNRMVQELDLTGVEVRLRGGFLRYLLREWMFQALGRVPDEKETRLPPDIDIYISAPKMQETSLVSADTVIIDALAERQTDSPYLLPAVKAQIAATAFKKRAHISDGQNIYSIFTLALQGVPDLEVIFSKRVAREHLSSLDSLFLCLNDYLLGRDAEFPRLFSLPKEKVYQALLDNVEYLLRYEAIETVDSYGVARHFSHLALGARAPVPGTASALLHKKSVEELAVKFAACIEKHEIDCLEAMLLNALIAMDQLGFSEEALNALVAGCSPSETLLGTLIRKTNEPLSGKLKTLRLLAHLSYLIPSSDAISLTQHEGRQHFQINDQGHFYLVPVNFEEGFEAGESVEQLARFFPIGNSVRASWEEKGKRFAEKIEYNQSLFAKQSCMILDLNFEQLQDTKAIPEAFLKAQIGALVPDVESFLSNRDALSVAFSLQPTALCQTQAIKLFKQLPKEAMMREGRKILESRAPLACKLRCVLEMKQRKCLSVAKQSAYFSIFVRECMALEKTQVAIQEKDLLFQIAARCGSSIKMEVQEALWLVETNEDLLVDLVKNENIESKNKDVLSSLRTLFLRALDEKDSQKALQLYEMLGRPTTPKWVVRLSEISQSREMISIACALSMTSDLEARMRSVLECMNEPEDLSVLNKSYFPFFSPLKRGQVLDQVFEASDPIEAAACLKLLEKEEVERYSWKLLKPLIRAGAFKKAAELLLRLEAKEKLLALDVMKRVGAEAAVNLALHYDLKEECNAFLLKARAGNEFASLFKKAKLSQLLDKNPALYTEAFKKISDEFLLTLEGDVVSMNDPVCLESYLKAALSWMKNQHSLTVEKSVYFIFVRAMSRGNISIALLEQLAKTKNTHFEKLALGWFCMLLTEPIEQMPRVLSNIQTLVEKILSPEADAHAIASADKVIKLIEHSPELDKMSLLLAKRCLENANSLSRKRTLELFFAYYKELEKEYFSKGLDVILLTDTPEEFTLDLQFLIEKILKGKDQKNAFEKMVFIVAFLSRIRGNAVIAKELFSILSAMCSVFGAKYKKELIPLIREFIYESSARPAQFTVLQTLWNNVHHLFNPKEDGDFVREMELYLHLNLLFLKGNDEAFLRFTPTYRKVMAELTAAQCPYKLQRAASILASMEEAASDKLLPGFSLKEYFILFKAASQLDSFEGFFEHAGKIVLMSRAKSQPAEEFFLEAAKTAYQRTGDPLILRALAGFLKERPGKYAGSVELLLSWAEQYPSKELMAIKPWKVIEKGKHPSLVRRMIDALLCRKEPGLAGVIAELVYDLKDEEAEEYAEELISIVEHSYAMLGICIRLFLEQPDRLRKVIAFFPKEMEALTAFLKNGQDTELLYHKGRVVDAIYTQTRKLQDLLDHGQMDEKSFVFEQPYWSLDLNKQITVFDECLEERVVARVETWGKVLVQLCEKDAKQGPQILELLRISDQKWGWYALHPKCAVHLSAIKTYLFGQLNA